ncbi:restriction endonuclease subunit S [Halorubrum sp. SS5]|nr:restriction endonuclease subunit S [Halorubrum sp. SS5]
MSEEATLDEFAESSYTDNSQERKETPVGELPTDWNVEWLKDVVEINPDGFFEDDWPSETFEYISLSEASDGKIEDSQTIFLEDAPSRAQRTVQPGDVLVGTVRPKQRSHSFVGEEHAGKVCSSGFGVLRTETQLNSRYLLQEILSNRFFSQMEAYVAGSGYPSVKISDLKKHRVAIPPLPEQRKIATVLYTVDRIIEKTEEIIDQTERVRRGYIKQQVLALNSDCDRQEGVVGTRRVSIPKYWETLRLGDVARIVSGKSFPKEYQEGNAGSRAVIKVEDMNLSGNDKYIRKVTNRVTNDVINELSKNIFPENTVIHPRVGEALLLNKTRITGEDAAFDDNIMGWVPKGIDPEYLYYASTLIDFNAVAQTGTVPSINKAMAANFRFPLPPEEEQKRIAENISRVDGQISIYEEEKSRLKRLKRGLMQDLLSGTVRTTDTNIEVPDEVAHHG